jgi:alpha-beta hydrolase superfamily lysophospholipase
MTATAEREDGRTAVLAALLLVAVGQTAAAQQADTVPPASVAESTYTFRSGMLTLEGTLARPRAGGQVPVALIVAGSGPTDRNGNAAIGLRPNVYAQLAWRLAERGVASLRYDKRVLPSARGSFDPAALTFDDLAGDLTAAARSLQNDGRFAGVVVIGHSEGGALGIRAVKNGLDVSGLALVSTAGRPLTAILHEQVGRQVDPATLARFDSAMVRYLRGEDAGDVPAPLAPLFLPVNQRYTQSVAEFDPVAELSGTSLPVLILQGSADIQVTVADAQALQRARTDALMAVVAGANHVLKPVTDTTLAGQLPAYRDPAIAIVPRVVDELVSWISVLR